MGICMSTTVAVEHLSGKYSGKSARSMKESFVLGTGLDADYHMFDEGSKVSRKHATLELDRSSRSWWIKDEGSSRGTWAAIGCKDHRSEPFPLFPGVMFKVGRVNFNVVDEEVAMVSQSPDGEDENGSQPNTSGYEVGEESATCTGVMGSGGEEGILIRKAGPDAVITDEDEPVFLKFRILKDQPPVLLKVNREFKIGTSMECDLRVPKDPDCVTDSVHTIIRKINGKYVIEDNKSVWGTYVKLGSAGAPFEVNWGDVVLLGHCKLLIKQGAMFTFVKKLDDCCMKAALKCFGVENITLHNAVGQSLGESTLFDRWLVHKESRDKRSDMSELKDWSTSVQMSEMRMADMHKDDTDSSKATAGGRGTKVSPIGETAAT